MSYRHQAHEKLASRCNLLPSHLQRMLRFSQIRLWLSSQTHMYVVWSKYGECLLPIDGEIRPRSCLPGNASAILGCPNLEIPASDDQRCSEATLNDMGQYIIRITKRGWYKPKKTSSPNSCAYFVEYVAHQMSFISQLTLTLSTDQGGTNLLRTVANRMEICRCGRPRTHYPDGQIHVMSVWRLILGLRPANERRRYCVKSSLIGWVQA